ncbi:VOC family protein [Microbacterium sp. ASV49]|uniref:VOC family protein n=1 Tax=Microbacterium candidum TaxID=3041922 RepID=A0ABT7MWD5_9MICO|nr:VOC family protein [Microbacterium sp. ASV49]MDL9978755.1 VOC family protein [Microbacterium sp. ASV49]
MTEFLRCEVFAADLDATADFYTRVLGFRIMRDGRDQEWGYLALERGSVRVGAARRAATSAVEHRRPPVGVELVLEVDDLPAERRRIADAGWNVVDEIATQPWGLTDFRLLDPDGYYWRLTTRE